MVTSPQSQRMDVESLLVEVADVLNTTLDLDTLLQRVAEVVKRVIDYEIFSILLLNERYQDLRFRFQIGHVPEVAERIRVKVGEGVTGRAVKERRAILVDDVSKDRQYIEAVPSVRPELAVPLITKNKVIGVIDAEAHEAECLVAQHGRLVSLIGSGIAVDVEDAGLWTVVASRAHNVARLKDIRSDVRSLLTDDELSKHIGVLLRKRIVKQRFS